MTKSISYCILICLGAVVVALAASAPDIIADKNAFFSAFVNHELLNILGVIVAITLASAAQLHLTLNSVEERLGQSNSFVSTRAGIRSSVYGLIVLFLIALVLVIVKPIIALENWSQTLVNGAAVVIIVWNVLVLISLTEAVFGIAPVVEDDEG
jgi:Flp pilus assembly protein TadB